MKSGSARSFTTTNASGVGGRHAREPVAGRRPPRRSRSREPVAPGVVADAAAERRPSRRSGRPRRPRWRPRRRSAERRRRPPRSRATGPLAEEVDDRLAEAEHGHARKITPSRSRCRVSGDAGLSSALGAPLARPSPARAFAALEPAAARPRRAHLPRRVLRAARLRDLEQHLVRRPLPALLQRAVPAARRAAVAGLGRGRGGGRERVAVRRPRARALGRARRAGPACGSPRSARSRCSRTAGWCSRSASRSRSARCARCSAGATGRRSRWRSARRWRARWRPRSWRWCARSARSIGAPRAPG